MSSEFKNTIRRSDARDGSGQERYNRLAGRLTLAVFDHVFLPDLSRPCNSSGRGILTCSSERSLSGSFAEYAGQERANNAEAAHLEVCVWNSQLGKRVHSESVALYNTRSLAGRTFDGSLAYVAAP